MFLTTIYRYNKKMSKILIKESDLIKLIETAMDLDIYNQPSTVDSDNGNLGIPYYLNLVSFPNH